MGFGHRTPRRPAPLADFAYCGGLRSYDELRAFWCDKIPLGRAGKGLLAGSVGEIQVGRGQGSGSEPRRESAPWCIQTRTVRMPWCVQTRTVRTPWCIRTRTVRTPWCIRTRTVRRMTPPAALHAEQSPALGVSTARSDAVAAGIGRLLDGRMWAQVRLLVDLVVLCVASIAALYAGPIPDSGRAQWIAGVFPLLTLALLRLRRDPDARLHLSPLDTAAYVLGAVSLSAMMMIAAGSVLGGSHPVGLAVRLWLFAAVYLTLARLVLGSVRLQAGRNEALATPTLIVGAGVVGERLVRRFSGDRNYGVRPVGFLDSDPMPGVGYAPAAAVPILGGLDDLADAIRHTNARRVILAFSSEPVHVLVEKVRECERLGIEVSLVPR